MALQVLHKRVPCREQEQSLFLTAVENTWIHGRQKRREGIRQLRELPRAPHCAGTSSRTSQATAAQSQSASTQSSNTQGDQDKTTSAQEQQPIEKIENGASSTETSKDGTHDPTADQKEVSVTGEDVDMESSTCSDAGQEAPAVASEPPCKRPPSPAAVGHFLLKCLLNVMLEEGDVVIEMHWVEGQSKDLMNQLCTYLKNTLLRSVAKP